MPHRQYSILHTQKLEPNEELIYIASSTYGHDWHSMFHSHNFVEIFFVIDGEGYFSTQTEDIPIQKSSLILINPDILHTEKSLSKNPLTYIVLGIRHLHIEFTKKESEYMVYQIKNDGEQILPIMEMMLFEIQKNFPLASTICQHLLRVLLFRLARITTNVFGTYMPAKNSINIPNECVYIKHYIDMHYQESINLDMLADIAHINKFYLSHIFTEAFSCSPIQYLIGKRIEHSKNLLSKTNYSMNMIAEIVGFSSGNYFSQAFKKYTGYSPVEWRGRV